ncbi:MAG: phage major capsid protein [Solirubrobacteraceae bacterium]
MPTITIDDQLADLRAKIEPARQDAQRKWSAFEKKRTEILDSGVSLADATDESSEAFRKLDDMHASAEAAAELHAGLVNRERMLRGDEPPARLGGRGPHSITLGASRDDGADPQVLDAIKNTPGALLSTMLERRKKSIATIPDHLRGRDAMPLQGEAWAQNTPITTANVNEATESAAVIDLFSPLSVALASGIQILRINGTKTRVPRFTELPEAAWIPELGAFPKNGPGIEMVDSEPPKVGLITEVSLEVFEDLRPITLSMLQLQMLRAIALRFDHGMLFGSGIGAEPLGIANTPGIQAVVGVPLKNLGAFAEALALLIGVNARPGALVMNPLDVGKLLQLTESVEGGVSNVPLWKASVGSASGLRLPYFDTPIWPTPAAPRGQALMYDQATAIAVIRREADIAIDPYYGFDNGIVGLRTYLRGEPIVGQVDGAVTIAFGIDATGLAVSDVITAPAHGFADGTPVTFSPLTGGAPLVKDTTYYVRDSVGNTFKVAATPGGAAINLTTDITAAVVRSVG